MLNLPRLIFGFSNAFEIVDNKKKQIMFIIIFIVIDNLNI